MRFWRSLGLAALAVVFLTLPARAQDSSAVAKPGGGSGSGAPERRAWMFGFHYGYGATRFVGSDRTVIAELRSDTGTEYPPLVTGRPDWSGTDFETGPALQFRVGYAINPKWSVGFERSQWTKDFEVYKWTFALSTMTATWYPGAGPLYMRGGVGICTLAEKVPSFFPESGVGITSLAAGVVYDDPFFVQYEDHGFGLEGALGYERRVYKRVAIAPEISFRSMTYAGGIRSQIGAASLGLNWWF